ncbi:MAG TPA: prolipoprotein diacylglyceryl transferase [Isosphaeraceae bacterium]|jgi:phosphatidylglycerol:prolipoprotein diacylglycerol transferase|nr:prolipoprotein diacylglyceryl transferase [Isosphaeraceae bacterium]
MYQTLLRIPTPWGTLSVPGFGLMFLLAFYAAMHLAAWRARREKLDPDTVFDLAIVMLFGGIVGARTLYVWQYWGDRVKSILDIFKVWEGGIVLYGSIAGGLLAGLIYHRIRSFPLRPMADVIAPALAVGIMLGRLGCFLNGCCYGDRCDLPWAVTFPVMSPPWYDQFRHDELDYPHGRPPWIELKVRDLDDHEHLVRVASRSLPVHPTQLYSALDGLILLLLLSAYFPLRRRDGEVMALLMVTYPITRMLIEYLRNDEASFLGTGLTISQCISLLILIGGLFFWARLSRLPKGRYADTA